MAKETMQLTLAGIQFARDSYNGKILAEKITIPRTGEADVISICSKDFLTEIEIKRSRSDFLADFKKPKHKLFNAGSKLGPNYFVFLCPDGLIKPEEVPKYAGLVYAVPDTIGGFFLHVVKKRKLLHGQKISPRFIRSLCTTLANRRIYKTEFSKFNHGN